MLVVAAVLMLGFPVARDEGAKLNAIEAQLQQIDLDLAQGSLDATQHQAARAEIERRVLEDSLQKDTNPILQYTASTAACFEPLLGIPYPRQLHQKLISMRDTGLTRISALGGTSAPAASSATVETAMRSLLFAT